MHNQHDIPMIPIAPEAAELRIEAERSKMRDEAQDARIDGVTSALDKIQAAVDVRLAKIERVLWGVAIALMAQGGLTAYTQPGTAQNIPRLEYELERQPKSLSSVQDPPRRGSSTRERDENGIPRRDPRQVSAEGRGVAGGSGERSRDDLTQ